MKKIVFIFIFLLGCSSSSFLIKEPLNQGCKTQGIQACSELLDGAIKFIDGDQIQGLKKIKGGLEKNSPEQVRIFLGILENIPGLEELYKSLDKNNLSNKESPEFLPKSINVTVANEKGDVPRKSNPLLEIDIKNPYINKKISGALFTETFSEFCHVLSIDKTFKCQKVIKIKTLTDLHFTKSCKDTIVVVAQTEHGVIVPIWASDLNFESFVLELSDAFLYVLSKDDNCIVSWRGYN